MSHIFRGLAAILFTAFALFGQQNNDRTLAIWDRSHATLQPPNLNDTAATSNSPAHAVASNIVTVQELSHKVPAKARKEMEKAEKARVKNRMDEAVSHFKQAILIDPEFVAARNNLAIAFFDSSKAEKGIEQLEEAIKIDPRSPILFTNLTVGYVLTNQYGEAERAARGALDLDPKSAQLSMILGVVLVEEHKFTGEALLCLERARDKYPLAHLLSGRVLMAQGDSERARFEIQTYLDSGEQEDRALAIDWLNFVNQYDRKNAVALSH